MSVGYVTKHAVRRGILKIDLQWRTPNGPYVRDAKSPSGHHYIMGVEVFQDPNAAVRDARRRRDARVASLEAEIVRLKLLDFVALA